MSQALRKLTSTIKKTNCMVIFINQIRMKIGVMFGSPETTTGGNALKFYASVRLDIRRTGTIKKGDEAIGNETKVKVVKNKVSPRSRPPSSTSSSAKASRAKVKSWTWASTPRSSTSRGLVRLQRRKDRPGSRQRPRIPAREQRPGRGDREQGARQPGHCPAAHGRRRCARSQGRQGRQGQGRQGRRDRSLSAQTLTAGAAAPAHTVFAILAQAHVCAFLSPGRPKAKAAPWGQRTLRSKGRGGLFSG